MVFEVALLLDIALILLVAKVFGEIAERAGVSSLIGEVAAGILLGPILLLVRPNDFLNQFSSLGLLFLLFILGLHTNFDSVKKDAYKGSIIAIIADGLSFVAGFLIGFFMFHSFSVGLLLGVALLSTSTAITLRSLADIGEVKTRVYELVLAVNMADEVISILALSLFVSFLTYGVVQIWTVVALFFAVLGFFLVITTFGSKAVTHFLDFFKMMRDEQIMIAIPLVIVFIVAFISEEVGIAGVTGAFLAGVAMSKSRMAESVIIPKIKIIGYGFFIPIFFAYSAVMFDLSSLSSTIDMILLLLVAGIITKTVGVGYFAKFLHFDKREQILSGVSMVPRGEYSIVLAQIGLAAGLITNQLYTIVMSFVVLSILVTPLLIKVAGKHKKF